MYAAWEQGIWTYNKHSTKFDELINGKGRSHSKPTNWQLSYTLGSYELD